MMIVERGKVRRVNRAGSPEHQHAGQGRGCGGRGRADQGTSDGKKNETETLTGEIRVVQPFSFLLPWLRAKIYLYLLPALETYQTLTHSHHVVWFQAR